MCINYVTVSEKKALVTQTNYVMELSLFTLGPNTNYRAVLMSECLHCGTGQQQGRLSLLIGNFRNSFSCKLMQSPLLYGNPSEPTPKLQNLILHIPPPVQLISYKY